MCKEAGLSPKKSFFEAHYTVNGISEIWQNTIFPSEVEKHLVKNAIAWRS